MSWCMKPWKKASMSMPPAGLWLRPKAMSGNIGIFIMVTHAAMAANMTIYTKSMTIHMSTATTAILMFTKIMTTMAMNMVMIIHMNMRHTRTTIFTGV